MSTYKPRYYQTAAVDAAMSYVSASIEPCLIEIATGGGKSYVVAEIATRVLSKSNGRRGVICLAPTSELVKQNRAKFMETGMPSSMYSASAGRKELNHPVVFATPGTLKSVARRIGSNYAAIIIDEGDGITPTVKKIVNDMREGNPNIRVIGLTATPYRLGEGYIFRLWPDGTANTDLNSKDPYYMKLVYRIGAKELIEQGFLTPPSIGETKDNYDTSGLKLNRMGKYDAADIDRAFVGHGRLTAAIVADVVARSVNRRGVMFFAATIEHANEVAASLPPELTRIVTGKTKERAKIIDLFVNQGFKYIVNVDVLTVGFDAPHVDVIAILRATESARLLQQIIGRATRLFEGKDDFLLLDYAGNISRHFPDGDVFNPDVKAKSDGETLPPVVAECPWCETEQEFSARPNEGGWLIDKTGYFTDLSGHPICDGEERMIPAHYGRRCNGFFPSQYRSGEMERCEYRWSGKDCEVCGYENDIAARYCKSCRAEMIDPNEKLKADFEAFKSDLTQRQTDSVVDMVVNETISRSGNETYHVVFTTPYRTIPAWFIKEPSNHFHQMRLDALMGSTENLTKFPASISYRRKDGKSLFEIMGFNAPIDEQPKAVTKY